jgi:integrase
VAKRVTQFTPNIPAGHWAVIEKFVREAVADCYGTVPYATRELLSAVTQFVYWCWQAACVPLDRALIFSRLQVEEWILHGTPKTWSVGTRRDRRTQLLRVCEALGGPEGGYRLSSFAPSEPLAPYTAKQIVALRIWARGQSTARKCRDAMAILALGLGAGLSSAEIQAVRKEHVICDAFGVLIEVAEGRRRFVPLLRAWEPMLLEVLAECKAGAFVFSPGRVGFARNAVSNFVKRCSRIDPPAQSQKMRATWIVHHLTVNTPVKPFMVAAGVDSLEALTRYLRFVPDIDPVEARAWLRGELRAEGGL